MLKLAQHNWTFKVAGIVSGNRVPKFVFGSYCGSQILNVFKRFGSWIQIGDLFSRIQQILMNPDTSLVHRRTMNRTNSYKSSGFRFANLHGFQKIRFVDSTWSMALKRFVSWILTGYLFSKDLFCGFNFKAKNLKMLNLYQFVGTHVQIPQP